MKIYKHTLIVLEEETEVRDLISAFFKSKDFEVYCFPDGYSALESLKKSKYNWDILISDFHIKDMKEDDFKIQMRIRYPQIKIIPVTPQELIGLDPLAIQYATHDFISKPLHLGQLLLAVDRAIDEVSLNETQFKNQHDCVVEDLDQKSFIGNSPKFLAALEVAKRVSKSSASVLLTGESGTGKEVFARFIHNNSKLSKGPFVAINCASISDHLLESELFGHAKGSFTGAIDKHIGLFETAENGTLFLDEIGDLSLALQSKLLRVLQEKKIKRVGENHDRPINCRIISATHKDLFLEINEGRFREDLFFRLNVIPITLPPLRQRLEDLLPLAYAFLKKYSIENRSSAKTFSKSAIRYILENPWKGNVRELENTIQRAVVLCAGHEISIDNFIPNMTSLNSVDDESVVKNDDIDSNLFSVSYSQQLPRLEEVIHKYISYAISKNGGARDKTAKDIGIDRKTLYKRMQFEVSNL